ncbi:hypothetical protein F2Q68_00001042 [Brassica cretica]|uniref:Uncharacterized protein n=1 Tax=Brassica cretica TaxID=69181 RepID=A0A8S9JLF9_BRACR|nr:hypothetical protein F2Q68_00001042 [Brassica cretica]
MPSVNGEDEPMARPMGVKTAKAKAKRPVGEEGKNLQELRQMWEIKTKDLIMKDKLSKTKLLDNEEEDMVELSFEEYMRNMGYLIRVEESVEDIEPEFRRMLKRMEQEEKKLREEKFKVLNSGIKLEVGQSSKGDGKKRKRRS